jgi:hypothetical protein
LAIARSERWLVEVTTELLEHKALVEKMQRELDAAHAAAHAAPTSARAARAVTGEQELLQALSELEAKARAAEVARYHALVAKRDECATPELIEKLRHCMVVAERAEMVVNYKKNRNATFKQREDRRSWMDSTRDTRLVPVRIVTQSTAGLGEDSAMLLQLRSFEPRLDETAALVVATRLVREIKQHLDPGDALNVMVMHSDRWNSEGWAGVCTWRGGRGGRLSSELTSSEWGVHVSAGDLILRGWTLELLSYASYWCENINRVEHHVHVLLNDHEGRLWRRVNTNGASAGNSFVIGVVRGQIGVGSGFRAGPPSVGWSSMDATSQGITRSALQKWGKIAHEKAL